jgi:hypothetical protein
VQKAFSPRPISQIFIDGKDEFPLQVDFVETALRIVQLPINISSETLQNSRISGG